ncbi:scavenger receptor class B member 1 isoform X1 [Anastrepha ludens]|uniref:scavenger receptor class B member 1 isoform X1 n=2 Tax=Anastrepha ludens TaxID=28586 RepID=UPI0023AED363|nr:scavenger receptor class B member 1 isoform X1 [Anastrepha ludens]
MKDLGKLFSRPYSAANTQDAEQLQQQQLTANIQSVMATATGPYIASSSSAAEKQRNKSLKANRSMNPAGILSSFFNERKTNKRARSPKCAFLLLALGVLAITTAVLVKIFQPYDLIFKWKLTMADDGEIFNLWAKPPVDLYIKIYLFNITNAEAFLAGREKMNVEQVGPYVYKEIMTHENITFNANNTMSTTPSHPLVWQEHMSEGHKEDDEVVMLNIAMLAISHLTADKPLFLRMGLRTLFATSKSQPIVRMTAKEFMFGYSSSLTTLGNTFFSNWISFEKVGLIDRMYDFSTDYETFYTGATNPGISGLYATYRGSTNLPQWDGEHCSNIELASDGTKFKSFIQPNDTIKFFRKSMCRPINLYRTGEPQTYGSLTGYKYVFEENAFDNGINNEANKCFCRKGKCQPQGLIDVTDCYYGFPISLSFPHFMHGDPGLLNNITGVEPDEKKFASAFVVQPDSGLPLSISAKVQINMHFDDMNAFRQVSRFSHLTIPMLWFDIMMPELPESLDTRFNFYLNILPYLDILGYWGSLVLGIALLLYAVTRATLRMSNLSQLNKISDGKYSKVNMLRGVANTHCNDVYKPCEMKLLHQHEKAQHLPHENDVIRRHDDDDMEAGVDLLYKEMASSQPRHSSFALELEPAISYSESGDDDDDDDSNSLTSSSLCSHNSSTCPCLLEQRQGGEADVAQSSISKNSSDEGYAVTPSETSINVDMIESNQNQQTNTALSIDAKTASKQTTTSNRTPNSIDDGAALRYTGSSAASSSRSANSNSNYTV